MLLEALEASLLCPLACLPPLAHFSLWAHPHQWGAAHLLSACFTYCLHTDEHIQQLCIQMISSAPFGRRLPHLSHLQRRMLLGTFDATARPSLPATSHLILRVLLLTAFLLHFLCTLPSDTLPFCLRDAGIDWSATSAVQGEVLAMHGRSALEPVCHDKGEVWGIFLVLLASG